MKMTRLLLRPASAALYNGQVQQLNSTPIPELAVEYEEADWRIIPGPHIDWNSVIFEEHTTAIVVSNDTGVLVLLIHYMNLFRFHGLRQLWVQAGQVLLPVHVLCDRIGTGLCKTLLKCHIGTGCDYMSKVGRKHSALDTVHHMQNHM